MDCAAFIIYMDKAMRSAWLFLFARRNGKKTGGVGNDKQERV